MHFYGRSLREGVEEHVIDGVPVRIYSAAKTVADCFEFRNKIGTDIAVEALRDYLKKHRAGGDALWRLAKICRVANVMRPCLEAAGRKPQGRAARQEVDKPATIRIQLGTALFNAGKLREARDVFVTAAEAEDASVGKQASNWIKFVDSELAKKEALRTG